MKILVALTYYTPYVSGLTIYADRIARAWAKRGHQVTVLTSRHDPSLPEEEVIDGVRVIRAPILFRISKGVIMPAFWHKAVHLIAESDVVNIHLPQFDAAWLARVAKSKKVFSVLTYHCDLEMPPGVVNQIANRFVLWMNNLAGKWANAIVAYTEDYAKHSFFLPRFMDKVTIIQPPVELPLVTEAEVEAFRQSENADEAAPLLGMACRFAADKGVEILLNALPTLLQRFPRLRVYFAGPYDNVLGERAYYDRLKPTLDRFIASGHWHFLGSLPPKEMAKFYQMIDVLTMPSLNRTDAFGLVQIEAMMNGKPVVASNLPGIRIPVQRHEMGQIAAIGDAQSLADRLTEVLNAHQDFSANREPIRQYYEPDRIAAAYEELFEKYGFGNEIAG